MKNPLVHLVPNSAVDLLWKALLTCCAISCLHIALQRFVLSGLDRSIWQQAIDAFVVGLPFVLVFFFGSWQQAEAVKALTLRARLDELSGCLNRQAFLKLTEKNMIESRRGLLMLIDADNFKRVNDLYGHAVGDECIASIGHRLRWHPRDEDAAGRIGGEEFAVFLADVTLEHGREVATRIGQPVSFSDRDKGVHLSITLSIGAVWTGDDTSLSIAHQLLLADKALYLAKTQGRAQLVFDGIDEPINLSGSSARESEVAA